MIGNDEYVVHDCIYYWYDRKICLLLAVNLCSVDITSLTYRTIEST